jgi:hypothetical protein
MDSLHKIIKKFSFFVILVVLLFVFYFSVKKQIKNKLTAEDLFLLTDATNEISQNLHESLYFAKELLSQNALDNFMLLKKERTRDIFLNKAIRTDKRFSFDNGLFCGDTVRFTFEKNKGSFKQGDVKDFELKFGRFNSAQEDLSGVDSALRQLEVGESGSFIVANQKKKIFKVKLISILRKTEAFIYSYFWHTPDAKQEYQFTCFDIVAGNFKIYDLNRNLLLSGAIKFNLGESYLPNFMERVILGRHPGFFNFLINGSVFKDEVEMGEFFRELMKANPKKFKEIKDKQGLFFEIEN